MLLESDVLMSRNIFCIVAGLALTVMVLSGCAKPRVEADVAAFSALSPEDMTKSIIVSPYKNGQSESLEWKHYASILERKLTEQGFSIAGSIHEAELVAYLGFAIDDGELVTTQYSVPQFGVTGYSSGYTTGTYTSGYGGIGSYNSTTTLNPDYGITGYSQQSRTDNVFTRSLSIDIV